MASLTPTSTETYDLSLFKDSDGNYDETAIVKDITNKTKSWGWECSYNSTEINMVTFINDSRNRNISTTRGNGYSHGVALKLTNRGTDKVHIALKLLYGTPYIKLVIPATSSSRVTYNAIVDIEAHMYKYDEYNKTYVHEYYSTSFTCSGGSAINGQYGFIDLDSYTTWSTYVTSFFGWHLTGIWGASEWKYYNDTKSFETSYFNYVQNWLATYFNDDSQFNIKSLGETYLKSESSYLSRLPVLVDRGDYTNNQSIFNAINNGDWGVEDLELPIDASTDWTLYIDGTISPNYKLVWQCGAIESDNTIDLTNRDIVTIRVHFGDTHIVGETTWIDYVLKANYTDGFIKFNFSDIINKMSWVDAVLSSKSNFKIKVQLIYQYAVRKFYKSAPMEVQLNGSTFNGKLYQDIAFADDAETTEDSSTLTVITGDDGSEDDGYKDRTDSDDADEDTATVASGLGTLTTTFLMTHDRLKSLGRFLWDSTILDNLALVNNNPIENIIACKSIPFTLAGTTQNIVLGNVNTGVNGDKLSTNFTEVTIGTVAISEYYNNFLDYVATKVTFYLPYIGFCEVDTTAVMGKTATIKYTIDVITGGLLGMIYVDSVRLYEYTSNIGIDIPVTASNRAQVESGYISGAIGAAGALVNGDALGVAQTAVSSALQMNHFSSTSAPNPSCVASTNRTCYVVIDRPTYDSLKAYAHTIGYMCNLSKTIRNLTGFTVCNSNIDLSDIDCTQTEKDELKNILSSGFFA